MARTRRLWVPLLAGLLVAGVLGGGGAVAVEPRTVTAGIMIPAAALIPSTDNWDYTSNGMSVYMNVGNGGFTAPVSFPVPAVNIKRITLYAYDNDPGSYLCVGLYRSRPAAGDEDLTGNVCTEDSSNDPQTVYTTAVSPRQVDAAFHAPYLWVGVGGPGLRFYGVKVTYAYETGA